MPNKTLLFTTPVHLRTIDEQGENLQLATELYWNILRIYVFGIVVLDIDGTSSSMT